MRFRPHAALRCPLDKLPLALAEGALRCDNRHSFDIARQGYVNLLSAGDKRSRDPGDSREMVAARHRFLEAGHYQPLADRLSALLLPYLAQNALIVDAGCGEGYYLHQLRRSLIHAGVSEPCLLGFDISKWALQAASRRFPATWLVASNRHIPLAEESVDVVIDMFGFPDFASFNRVLKPSGLLLRAEAGGDHLLELREVIYPTVKPPRDSAPKPAGFFGIDSDRLEYVIERLDQPAIADLLLMTPHHFRASNEGRSALASVEQLSPRVDVQLTLLQKQ